MLADMIYGVTDKEKSGDRVLLLASERCLGGAQEFPGDQAMDSREVQQHI